MKLNDKIYEAIHLEIYKNERDNCDGFREAANNVEVITDEFTVGFTEWIFTKVIEREYTLKQLLEIYKKEKGL